MALFAIIDPIGNVAVFGILTAKATTNQRLGAALLSVGAAAAILIPATYFGGSVLSVLGIGIESFQIAAGILLLFPAVRLVEHGLPMDPADVDAADSLIARAFVPLGTPLLAGPGSIATAVVFRETLGAGVTVAAIVAILALTGVLFAVTARIMALLGRTAVLVMARMVGILLTAIAVQLIVRGVGAIF